MHSTLLITAPVENPLTLAEAKQQVALADSITHHDSHLNRLILAAVEYAEARTGRAILAQTWEVKLDRFPGRTVQLPIGPLRSIEHVQYTNPAGDIYRRVEVFEVEEFDGHPTVTTSRVSDLLTGGQTDIVAGPNELNSGFNAVSAATASGELRCATLGHGTRSRRHSSSRFSVDSPPTRR